MRAVFRYKFDRKISDLPLRRGNIQRTQVFAVLSDHYNGLVRNLSLGLAYIEPLKLRAVGSYEFDRLVCDLSFGPTDVEGLYLSICRQKLDGLIGNFPCR